MCVSCCIIGAVVCIRALYGTIFSKHSTRQWPCHFHSDILSHTLSLSKQPNTYSHRFCPDICIISFPIAIIRAPLSPIESPAESPFLVLALFFFNATYHKLHQGLAAAAARDIMCLYLPPFIEINAFLFETDGMTQYDVRFE